MPTIGFLSGRSPAEAAHLLGAFRQGLNETGYVEGKNVGIEFRWAEGDYNRLPALASDLVRRDVAILVATGGPRSVLAAKAATSTIPIVFTMGGDPVEAGVVKSLAHPGGNANRGKQCGGQHNRQRQAGQWTPSRRGSEIVQRDDVGCALCSREQGSHAPAQRARCASNDFDRVIAGSCGLVAWPGQKNVLAFRHQLRQRRVPALEAHVA
jgi:ABC transporter substrate binding protein